MDNLWTIRALQAPNESVRHFRINEESTVYGVCYKLGLDISRPEPEPSDDDRD